MLEQSNSKVQSGRYKIFSQVPLSVCLNMWSSIQTHGSHVKKKREKQRRSENDPQPTSSAGWKEKMFLTQQDSK